MISVIIPAHNESSVIARTLSAITEGAVARELDVIVVCNGCTDDTADVARAFRPRVRVIETSIARKTHALNLGEDAAQGFPRIYADADIILPLDAIRALALRLERRDVMAAAPTPSFDLSECSWGVRACYEIRSLLPSAREGIGGSGVYALSETGRSRFGEFPNITADDGFVRIQFHSEERETLADVHSKVFPPRTLRDLIATKTRAHYGSYELAGQFPELWQNRGESNDRSLLQLFRNPLLWPKLAIYCAVTLIAKHRAKKRMQAGSAGWERDNTSRAASEPATLTASYSPAVGEKQPVEHA